MNKKRYRKLSQKLQAQDKVTQKMTAEGAVLENQRTGETEQISQREPEADFTKAPEAKAVRRQSSRLNFTEEERTSPELQKYAAKSDKAADKLDAARANLPTTKKLTKQRVYDEAKGKAKTRLSFEEVQKRPNGKLRHNPLSRPAQEVGGVVHGKVQEVEKENSGVEAGHKGEQAAEWAGGKGARLVRSGYRHHRLKPYRAAEKAEKAAAKANADFYYQKALHDNPQLAHSNPLSRFMQKQQIKRQYAKAARTGGAKAAKTAAENTKRAAKKSAESAKKAAEFFARHWKGCLLVLLLMLMASMLFSGLSSCSVLGGNGGSGIIASSYLSEDADILGAEAAYAEMEAELQAMLDNIESEYPGYDEYRVTADEIGHDPYVLASILSAWHEGVFTLAEAQEVLELLFEKQYILTVTEEVEIRYRTETDTWTDDEGNTHTDTYEVPYEYYILNVDLENFNLSHVPVYIMDEDRLSLYAIYMSTLGNRPDLFPSSSYIQKYITDPPTDYEIPAAHLTDEAFATLIEEAEKYLNYPYVWGGSSPETSFDCSGFVSYVLTSSGLRNTGRLGAQGLYNISTPVSSPKPGDLVFFTGTYDTPGVSHVGIYVGDGMMLHCGDPIQYSSLNTSYWQSHFYAYGRIL